MIYKSICKFFSLYFCGQTVDKNYDKNYKVSLIIKFWQRFEKFSNQTSLMITILSDLGTVCELFINIFVVIGFNQFLKNINAFNNVLESVSNVDFSGRISNVLKPDFDDF